MNLFSRFKAAWDLTKNVAGVVEGRGACAGCIARDGHIADLRNIYIRERDTHEHRIDTVLARLGMVNPLEVSQRSEPEGPTNVSRLRPSLADQRNAAIRSEHERAGDVTQQYWRRRVEEQQKLEQELKSKQAAREVAKEVKKDINVEKDTVNEVEENKKILDGADVPSQLN